MKTLIIIKPSALAKKALGLILAKIENYNLAVISIKTVNFDVHLLEKKFLEEKENEEKNRIQNAKKIPCVLVLAQGENAIDLGQKMKKELGDDVHVSLNEETAKYEINRFFDKSEIFENNAKDGDYFLAKKSHKDFLHKSVKEIAKEAVELKN